MDEGLTDGTSAWHGEIVAVVHHTYRAPSVQASADLLDYGFLAPAWRSGFSMHAQQAQELRALHEENERLSAARRRSWDAFTEELREAEARRATPVLLPPSVRGGLEESLHRSQASLRLTRMALEHARHGVVTPLEDPFGDWFEVSEREEGVVIASAGPRGDGEDAHLRVELPARAR